jgi:hypothetical protein
MNAGCCFSFAMKEKLTLVGQEAQSFADWIARAILDGGWEMWKRVKSCCLVKVSVPRSNVIA